MLAHPPRGLPHLPRFDSAGFTSEAGWIIRELLPGELLSDTLKRGGPLECRRVINCILGELCVLESQGLWHNDLQPWNVLVCPDGSATLIDYASITPVKRDVVSPQPLEVVFLNLVRVLLASKPYTAAERDPRASPEHFPAEYQAWIRALWAMPPAAWSFALIQAIWELLAMDSAAGAPRALLSVLQNPNSQPLLIWRALTQQAHARLERQIQRAQRQSRQTSREWFATKQTVAFSETQIGAIAQQVQGQQQELARLHHQLAALLQSAPALPPSAEKQQQPVPQTKQFVYAASKVRERLLARSMAFVLGTPPMRHLSLFALRCMPNLKAQLRQFALRYELI